MFGRVLIANRGEAALRVLRTCREMDVSAVVAHSEADRNSLAVRLADERVCIGPPDPARSYLNTGAILSAAQAFRCDAVHPGYGFLSESPDFARACVEAGIGFVGPSVDCLRLMGDKIEARRTAARAGSPVIPGSDGAVAGTAQALETAGDLGYPVLLKAASGGGGRGIRRVDRASDMERELAEARAEAKACFGDDRVYVEALLSGMRHVEVQILGDGRGRAVHLYERDCSLQRRRQKLVEEAPAALIDPDLGRDMRLAAVRLARDIGYSGAGTVEFLTDGRAFYFMEMNTRLQVEHTVTEMVANVDIVREQLLLASGNGLGLAQEDVVLCGHAVECRINAEDPATQAPCPGTVSGLSLPGGPGVRVDTALFPGAEVPVWYDSLVAKIIVLGRDRDQAVQRMRRALAET
ncbi:MAG: biotin carboxylase N-terminal domain-containing protein, partial [Desulfovibrionaceae bacterium]|nr:biotin carboxylase N-terminal domain-containing protein [Desulfovibrionaceae bacterium]